MAPPESPKADVSAKNLHEGVKKLNLGDVARDSSHLDPAFKPLREEAGKLVEQVKGTDTKEVAILKQTKTHIDELRAEIQKRKLEISVQSAISEELDALSKHVETAHAEVEKKLPKEEKAKEEKPAEKPAETLKDVEDLIDSPEKAKQMEARSGGFLGKIFKMIPRSWVAGIVSLFSQIKELMPSLEGVLPQQPAAPGTAPAGSQEMAQVKALTGILGVLSETVEPLKLASIQQEIENRLSPYGVFIVDGMNDKQALADLLKRAKPATGPTNLAAVRAYIDTTVADGYLKKITPALEKTKKDIKPDQQLQTTLWGVLNDQQPKIVTVKPAAPVAPAKKPDEKKK